MSPVNSFHNDNALSAILLDSFHIHDDSLPIIEKTLKTTIQLKCHKLWKSLQIRIPVLSRGSKLKIMCDDTCGWGFLIFIIGLLMGIYFLFTLRLVSRVCWWINEKWQLWKLMKYFWYFVSTCQQTKMKITFFTAIVFLNKADCKFYIFIDLFSILAYTHNNI